MGLHRHGVIGAKKVPAVVHLDRGAHSDAEVPADPAGDAAAEETGRDFGRRRGFGESRSRVVRIDGTTLDVRVGPYHHQFELAPGRVSVVGEPGTKDWKVLLQRRSLPPYVLDADVVGDPEGFTAALREIVPGLRVSAAGGARAARPQGRRRPPGSPASRRQ